MNKFATFTEYLSLAWRPWPGTRLTSWQLQGSQWKRDTSHLIPRDCWMRSAFPLLPSWWAHCSEERGKDHDGLGKSELQNCLNDFSSSPSFRKYPPTARLLHKKQKVSKFNTFICNHPLITSLHSVGAFSYLNNQQPGIWKCTSNSGFCLGETQHFCQFHASKYEQYEFPSMIQNVFIKRNRRSMLIISEHFDLCSHLLYSHHLKENIMPHFSICAEIHTIYR